MEWSVCRTDKFRANFKQKLFQKWIKCHTINESCFPCPNIDKISIWIILVVIATYMMSKNPSHWTEMPNLSWKLFLRLYLLEMAFLYASSLHRYQRFQKNVKTFEGLKTNGEMLKTLEKSLKYSHNLKDTHIF